MAPGRILAFCLLALVVAAACSTAEAPTVPALTPTALRQPEPSATPVPSPFPTAEVVAPTSTVPPPTPTKVADTPTAQSGGRGMDIISVAIGRAVFRAEVAATEGDRIQGLSDREGLAEDMGMLFVYEDRTAGAFWMHGMRFALDFIWISVGCRVVDLDQGVPPPEPGTPDAELDIYHSDEPAAYVLEVNAGDVARHGILPGMGVAFSDSEQGLSYGCEK